MYHSVMTYEKNTMHIAYCHSEHFERRNTVDRVAKVSISLLPPPSTQKDSIIDCLCAPFLMRRELYKF